MITREQVQEVQDLEYEELFVPEWLNRVRRVALRGIEDRIAALNGESPEELYRERDGIRQAATCRVYMLSAAECEKLQNKTRASLTNNKDANVQNFFARLAVATVRNENGEPIFKDADVKWLGDKSFKSLNRIANVAMRLNGLSQNDQDELLKNSEATHG